VTSADRSSSANGDGNDNQGVSSSPDGSDVESAPNRDWIESENSGTHRLLCPPPQPATKDDIQQAQKRASELLASIEGVGPGVVERLTSTRWADRKESYERICEWVSSRTSQVAAARRPGSSNAGGRNGQTPWWVQREFVAVVVLVTPAVDSPVAPVVLSACLCLLRLLKTYSPALSWKDTESWVRVHAIVPCLLKKVHSSNKRVAQEATKCLQELASSGHGLGLRLVMPHVCAVPAEDKSAMPLPYSSSGKGALVLPPDEHTPEANAQNASAADESETLVPAKPRARMTILKLLVTEFGITVPGGGGLLPLGQTVGCALCALQEADEKARKAATAVLVTIAQSAGQKRVLETMGRIAVVEETDEIDRVTGGVLVNAATLKMVKQKLKKLAPEASQSDDAEVGSLMDDAEREHAQAARGGRPPLKGVHGRGMKQAAMGSSRGSKKSHRSSSVLRPLKFGSGAVAVGGGGTNRGLPLRSNSPGLPAALSSSPQPVGLGPAFDMDEESFLNSIEQESIAMLGGSLPVC